MGRGTQERSSISDQFAAIMGTRRGTNGAPAPFIPTKGDDYVAAEERVGFNFPVRYQGVYLARQYHMNFIVSGEFMRKESTGALYRGHIVLADDPKTGERVLCALCTYGAERDGDGKYNPVYWGTDLGEAVKKLNAKLSTKMRASRGAEVYTPDSGDPKDAKITAKQFQAAFLARDPAFGGTPIDDISTARQP